MKMEELLIFLSIVLEILGQNLPYVFVGGEGVGAVASALLDENGFLTEIRVQSPGYGYKLNRAEDKGVRCIIDSFTILQTWCGIH